MKAALKLAQKSAEEGRGSGWLSFVRDGKIVGRGKIGARQKSRAHAGWAIGKACKKSWLAAAQMRFVCDAGAVPMCAVRLSMRAFARCITAPDDSKAGSCGSLINLIRCRV